MSETACLQCGGIVPARARVCSLQCAQKCSIPGPAGDPALSWQKVLEERDAFDVVAAARDLLRLLEEVDREQPSLMEAGSASLQAAINRYQRVWLPFLAAHDDDGSREPPLDVEWVWLLHRLAPCTYYEDCMRLYGRLLERPLCTTSRKEAQAQTRALWEAYTGGGGEQWNVPDQDEAVAVACCEIPENRRVSYDLETSARAQAQFFYQTSRPQFRDATFLTYGRTRYLRFLSITPRRTEHMIVPTYDVDLLWHAHMTYPQLYRRHCLEFVGFVVWHDDSHGLVKDCRTKGSSLDVCFRATGQAYAFFFSDNYHRLECEYRGHSRPIGWHYENSLEHRLTQLRPKAIMVGGRLPPNPAAEPTLFDASDPRNEHLHKLWREYDRSTPAVQPRSSLLNCPSRCRTAQGQSQIQAQKSRRPRRGCLGIFGLLTLSGSSSRRSSSNLLGKVEDAA